jgi:hypothetical protein
MVTKNSRLYSRHIDLVVHALHTNGVIWIWISVLVLTPTRNILGLSVNPQGSWPIIPLGLMNSHQLAVKALVQQYMMTHG